MFELVAILTGTALVSMLVGFIWARLDRNATRPRDWDTQSAGDDKPWLDDILKQLDDDK